MNVITTDMINGAARLCNAIATGETLDGQELTDALQVLNEMIDAWNIESMQIWGSLVESFPTVAGKGIYTMGPSAADFNTNRPTRIEGAFYTINGIDYDVEIVGQERYNLLTLKTQPGVIVEQLCYLNTYPNGTLMLWPVPSVVGTLNMQTDRQIASIPTAPTVVAWPPGYAKALRYNLAVMLAAEYGVPCPDDVKDIAKHAKGKIKVSNTEKREMRFDGILTGDGPANWQRGF